MTIGRDFETNLSSGFQDHALVLILDFISKSAAERPWHRAQDLPHCGMASSYQGSRFTGWIIALSLPLAGFSGLAASRADVIQSVTSATEYLDGISTNGGFVGIYSIDLKQRFGEAVYEKASDDEIWVQAPGTPTVGQVYLRLHRVTALDPFLTMARKIGRALAWGQSLEGGWDHRVDVSGLTDESVRPNRQPGRGSFDDRISQGALEFLMALDQVLDEAWLEESVQLGIDFVRSAQFSNGAWPQWFPLRGGYHDHFTFNDHAINDCIAVMLKAHRVYGDPRCLESALRGGAFIRLSQVGEPQAGWAQQYSHDLRPAWARRFEPPGVCSAVTVNNLRTLLELFLESGDQGFLEPFESALDWLGRSQLRPDQISTLKFPLAGDREQKLWARLYEEGSNRPIYGDREVGDEVFYDLDAISERERNSYGWQGSYGVNAITVLWAEIQQTGPSRWRQIERQRRVRVRKSSTTDAAVDAILRGQDAEGRWTREGKIYIGDFVSNLTVLTDYLEMSQ